MKKQFDIVCEDILKDARKKQLIEEGFWRNAAAKLGRKLHGFGNKFDDDAGKISSFNKRFVAVLEENYKFKKSTELSEKDKKEDLRVWEKTVGENKIKVKLGSFLIQKSSSDDEDEIEEKLADFAVFKVFVDGKGLKSKIGINEGMPGIEAKLLKLLASKGLDKDDLTKTPPQPTTTGGPTKDQPKENKQKENQSNQSKETQQQQQQQEKPPKDEDKDKKTESDSVNAATGGF